MPDEHRTFGRVLEGMFRRAGFCTDRTEYGTPTRAFYRCSKQAGVA